MITQMQAITGRKPKRRYADIINARLPYLPALYAAKEERKYREEMTDLEKERLAEEKRRGKKALELSEEQAKKSNILGLANIGLTAGLKRKELSEIKDILTADEGDATGELTGVGTGITEIAKDGVDKEGMFEGFGGALKSPSTYGTGMIGGLAGSVLGGKSKTKSALIGAGVGALASLLGGGESIYEHIVSGLIGGGLGGLL